MGGSNPYIESAAPALPKKKYTLTFLPEDRKLEIDPAQLPSSATGLEGSILSIALALGLDIDHACGGVCACSTCHIYVREGLESCNPTTESEDDELEKAPGLSSLSRLACQCVPDGSRSIVVEIPKWNRNLVREGS